MTIDKGNGLLATLGVNPSITRTLDREVIEFGIAIRLLQYLHMD